MTVTKLTREQAIENYKVLVRKYGIQWTARVPREAYDQLNACNAVLTTQDRRQALGLH